ncbi:MAG: hypothetical protein LAKADJCE_00970 [Candidatus Argoarchaeum ethanivorans]|uniref:Uncharacterized protein n=1 Tax=Candidatus Argoarchaeum ethanivorans TaxID=2608793 RepID=A0A811TBH2_9EURY|nr:MAG: hypothetical protein LAKADJCE_00970 [Candidatus Argoarchaeum ethanivorans]
MLLLTKSLLYPSPAITLTVKFVAARVSLNVQWLVVSRSSTAPTRYQSGIPPHVSLPSMYVTPWHETVFSNSACVITSPTSPSRLSSQPAGGSGRPTSSISTMFPTCCPPVTLAPFRCSGQHGLPDGVSSDRTEPLSLFATI